MAQTYDDKRTHYFADTRSEIEPLLDACADSALEIGCGSGSTMKWLKATGRVKRAVGVDMFETAAQQAKPFFEDIFVGDAEVLITTMGDRQFDLILCLDVLEHMVDPWRFVATAELMLSPHGRLIISVPNIRCLRVLWPLLVRGEWNYQDDGILDRTHLRFFTRKTAVELAKGKRLKVIDCLAYTKPQTRLATIDHWSKGLLSDFTAQQFLVSASNP